MEVMHCNLKTIVKGVRAPPLNSVECGKIGFKSITENIDTTTSGGKLVFHIFGALAEFERDIISERTNAGLSAARARGRLGGRPKAKMLDTPKKVALAQSQVYSDKRKIAQTFSVYHILLKVFCSGFRFSGPSL